MTIARMRVAGGSQQPAFRAAHRRYLEGLRLSGLPEGEPPAKVAEVAPAQNRK
jgi:hypothetical protein